MKTSNKILIGFGLALILIPLLGMVYQSAVNFKVGKPGETYDVVYDNNHFKSKAPNMTATTVPAFSGVKLANAQNYQINIRLVADQDYGVKVQNSQKDNVIFKVDADGILNIDLKDRKEEEYHFVTLIVYAPNINDLIVAKANRLILTVSQDSLAVKASEIGMIEFGSAKNTKQISISTDNVKNIKVYNEVINSLILNLKNTDFETEKSSFANLSITSAGKANVLLTGDEKNDAKYKVDNLSLSTTGEAKVTFSNIKVLNCSGALSDQTSVDMPIVNLKQMFKK